MQFATEIPPDLADSRDNAASDNGTSSILGNTIFAIRQDGKDDDMNLFCKALI